MIDLIKVDLVVKVEEEWKISEEELCDISACSHDIIHKIVEDYFKEVD